MKYVLSNSFALWFGRNYFINLLLISRFLCLRDAPVQFMGEDSRC